MSAHDAMAALARDLVTELATGMALELAVQGAAPASQAPLTPAAVPKAKTGAAAVHPQLGVNLLVPPGDTISGLAYAHLQPPQLPGQQQGGAPGGGPV